MPDINPYLEFLLSDHPAAARVRIWRRLCSRYGPQHAHRAWLALDNRLGYPADAAEASWAVRDQIEVTYARITLEEVIRCTVDASYRYPDRYVGVAAVDAEALLEVEPDRPFPSPDGEAAERLLSRAAARRRPIDPAHPWLDHATFARWMVAALPDEPGWESLPGRAELILIPADSYHSLLRARTALAYYRQGIENYATCLAAPVELHHPDDEVRGFNERLHASLLEAADWCGAAVDRLEAALADALSRLRRQELGTRSQRALADRLLRLADTDPAVTGLWAQLAISQRAAAMRQRPTPTLWYLAERAAAELPACPPDRSGELAAAEGASTTLLGWCRDLRAALLTADDRPWWRRLLQRGADRRRQAALQTDLAAAQARLDDAERQCRALRAAQQQRAAWLANHTTLTDGVLAAVELRVRTATILHELACSPPDYLLAELGPPPSGRALEAWLDSALLIERYRADHAITDTARALGRRPTDPKRRARYDRTAQRLRARRTALGRGHEPPTRPPFGPDLPAGFD